MPQCPLGIDATVRRSRRSTDWSIGQAAFHLVAYHYQFAKSVIRYEQSCAENLETFQLCK
jgi:hypothetical protein